MTDPSLSSTRDSAIGDGIAATSTPVFIISGIVVVGTALFIIALALGLGLGFGIGLNNESSRPTVSKLPAPTVNCDASGAQCGCAASKPSFSSRIINGDAAVTNSWPWLVYLVMNNQKICTGFLISQRHVLTAATCVSGYAYNVTVTLGINNYQFTYGSINVTNTTSLSAITLSGDIAVVTLGTNVSYSSAIKPCCLTSNPLVTINGTNGVIAGWGETSANNIGNPSPMLRQAVVQIRDPSVCSSTANDTLCASYGSISTCPVDAGGPLMVSTGSAWACVGIITGKSTCSNPITFTRVSTYFSLINNVTGLTFT